jgi:hypothetical protein
VSTSNADAVTIPISATMTITVIAMMASTVAVTGVVSSSGAEVAAVDLGEVQSEIGIA